MSVELDRLVSLHVFGSKNDSPPEYSSRIAEAWKVIGAISYLRLGPEKHPQPDLGMHACYKPVIRIDMYEHDDLYTCTIGRVKGIAGDGSDVSCTVTPHAGGADSVGRGCAEAICRAALKLLGVEV